MESVLTKFEDHGLGLPSLIRRILAHAFGLRVEIRAWMRRTPLTYNYLKFVVAWLGNFMLIYPDRLVEDKRGVW